MLMLAALFACEPEGLIDTCVENTLYVDALCELEPSPIDATATCEFEAGRARTADCVLRLRSYEACRSETLLDGLTCEEAERVCSYEAGRLQGCHERQRTDGGVL